MKKNAIKENMKNIPVLLIDFKKNRLRLHKNTLSLIGNPSFVQFLVNPDKQTLVIIPGDPDDKLSHRIRWSLLDSGQCCEFYSKYLIKTLQTTFFPDVKASCRFYGEIIKAEENIAFFSLKNPAFTDAYDDLERITPHELS